MQGQVAIRSRTFRHPNNELLSQHHHTTAEIGGCRVQQHARATRQLGSPTGLMISSPVPRQLLEPILGIHGADTAQSPTGRWLPRGGCSLPEKPNSRDKGNSAAARHREATREPRDYKQKCAGTHPGVGSFRWNSTPAPLLSFRPARVHGLATPAGGASPYANHDDTTTACLRHRTHARACTPASALAATGGSRSATSTTTTPPPAAARSRRR